MHYNRYSFLDGMRGVAALCVVTLHTRDFWHFSPYRSYLAVDLFFILSGFVIAHAYDEKLENGNMSFSKFVVVRLIRLYPIFIFSLLLAVAALIGKALQKHQLTPDNLMAIGGLAAMTALFLPSKVAGNTALFPLNHPCWSLFFELVANFIYAAARPLLTSTVLSTIVICSGVCVVGVACYFGNLNAGYSWDMASFVAGFLRSIFGIFLGLLLHRHRALIARRFNFSLSPWLTLLAVVAVFASPSVGRFDPLVDVLVVGIVFPLCVIIASRARSTKLEGVLRVLGSASYPIYVLHIPVTGLVAHAFKGVVVPYAPLSGMVLLIFLVVLSLVVEKYYDIPVRKWLSGVVLNRRPAAVDPIAP